MAKRKGKGKGKKKSPFFAALENFVAGDREYKIMEASVHDEKCNYSYQVIHGKKLGETHAVKGPGIAKSELFEAFSRFNVHLAVLDDAYKLSDTQIGDINQCHGEEITLKYTTNGFKMKGAGDSETIELHGTKYSQTAQGRMAIATNKIPLDKLSHYPWWNELKTAADNARELVARYNEGDFIPIKFDDDEEEENPLQLTIASGTDEDKQEVTVPADDNTFDEPF